MNIKNTAILFSLLLAFSGFAQKKYEGLITNPGLEKKTFYLDSIKKTFVNDAMTSRVDSLWLNQLTSLDIYNDLENDIKSINVDEKVDYELPTELLKERLAAMDAKSPFNIEYNQGLENIIKSFLKNRKKSFEHLMAVSEYYFPLFEEALAKQNVPLEIKYLAVVESALNPKAVSRVGATGLWQFMYQTGKQYKLSIDSYVDERSDPLKSSAAAAQYMTNMYSIFNDWDLVLASYNSGPGNVAKAIRRSGGKHNYWNIRKNLPKETQGYVPAFLATMYIYEYHAAHGIVPDRALIKHFATDTVRIKNQMSFKQISDLLDIPVAQLQLLNPSYKLNVVPAYKNQSHYLRLPQEKVALFTSNEDKIYAYTAYEESFRERAFQNTKAIAAKDSIASRAKLLAISEEKRRKESKTVSLDTTAVNSPVLYTVQKGDNLNAIAKKFNVTVADLESWNTLSNNSLKIGASLQIAPAETVCTESVASAPVVLKDIEYEVQKGDNLGAIAKRFGATIVDLKQWNNLSGTNLALGTKLIVAKNEPAITTNLASVDSFKKKGTYTKSNTADSDYYVKKGDSLYSISKKYPGVTISDLKKWNDIKEGELKPGMKLKING